MGGWVGGWVKWGRIYLVSHPEAVPIPVQEGIEPPVAPPGQLEGGVAWRRWVGRWVGWVGWVEENEVV